MSHWWALVSLTFLAINFFSPIKSVPVDMMDVDVDEDVDNGAGEEVDFDDEMFADSVQCGVNGTLTFKSEVNSKFQPCAPKYRDKQDSKKCVLFCHGGAARLLLTEDGLPDPHLFDAFVKKAFPHQYREEAAIIVKSCFDHHATSIDLMDESCQGVGTFFGCLGKTMAMEC